MTLSHNTLWIPTQEWAGQDAYIIGGGPSLRGFPFHLLKDRNTIGCNSAFQLGPEIVKVLLFSDKAFFDQIIDGKPVYEHLENFPNLIVTNLLSLRLRGHAWLKVMERWGDSLCKAPTEGLTFLGCSGGSAINLALHFGCKRVYLLGFDCKHYDIAQPNWHRNHRHSPKVGLYDRFSRGFVQIAAEVPQMFPGCEVINLGPDSALECFPKQDWREHFNYGRSNHS